MIKVKTITPKDWNEKGRSSYKSETFEGEIKVFDRALEIDPEKDNALGG